MVAAEEVKFGGGTQLAGGEANLWGLLTRTLVGDLSLDVIITRLQAVTR